MKILLLGKNGQVGWELQRALAPLGSLVALDRHSDHGGLCGDLSRTEDVIETIRVVKPDVIVNAAAYTAVDSAEADRHEATMINVTAVEAIAKEARQSGALFVHYSTDYVFDGSGSKPWTEEDLPAPMNHYGASKLAGERRILDSGCRHLILRTSWVYSARRSNFAKTMLRLAGERDSLAVINDQVGAPTGADLLADVIAHIIPMALAKPQLCGLYHLCAAGETTWYEYAKFVIECARREGFPLKAASINGIPSSGYPAIAARPLNSRMCTDKLASAFSVHLPDWQAGVARMIHEVLGK